MRELVHERLNRERDAVRTWSAEWARRNTERHARHVEHVVRYIASGEFSRTHRTARRAVERHEMVAPRRELALCVDAAREIVEACDAIWIVRDVVLARPQQLDGHAG